MYTLCSVQDWLLWAANKHNHCSPLSQNSIRSRLKGKEVIKKKKKTMNPSHRVLIPVVHDSFCDLHRAFLGFWNCHCNSILFLKKLQSSQDVNHIIHILDYQGKTSHQVSKIPSSIHKQIRSFFYHQNKANRQILLQCSARLSTEYKGARVGAMGLF